MGVVLEFRFGNSTNPDALPLSYRSTRDRAGFGPAPFGSGSNWNLRTEHPLRIRCTARELELASGYAPAVPGLSGIEPNMPKYPYAVAPSGAVKTIRRRQSAANAFSDTGIWSSAST